MPDRLFREALSLSRDKLIEELGSELPGVGLSLTSPSKVKHLERGLNWLENNYSNVLRIVLDSTTIDDAAILLSEDDISACNIIANCIVSHYHVVDKFFLSAFILKWRQPTVSLNSALLEAEIVFWEEIRNKASAGGQPPASVDFMKEATRSPSLLATVTAPTWTNPWASGDPPFGRDEEGQALKPFGAEKDGTPKTPFGMDESGKGYLGPEAPHGVGADGTPLAPDGTRVWDGRPAVWPFLSKEGERTTPLGEHTGWPLTTYGLRVEGRAKSEQTPRGLERGRKGEGAQTEKLGADLPKDLVAEFRSVVAGSDISPAEAMGEALRRWIDLRKGKDGACPICGK